MPKDIPIFVGHIKPCYQTEVYNEIEALENDRITLIGSDDTSYVF